MLLDVPPLILLAAIACWALGVAAWRATDTESLPLFRGWAVAMFLEGLALLLFLLRGLVPDWLSIVVANILLTSAYALIGQTIARYRQIDVSPWLLLGPPLLILLVFPAILDQQATRNLFAAVVEGAQICLALVLLLRRGGAAPGIGYRLLSLGLMLALAIFVLRIATTVLGNDQAPNVTSQHPLQVITFAVGLVSILFTGTGFIFMVKDEARDRRPASADFSTSPATNYATFSHWLLLTLALTLLGAQMGYDLWQARQEMERTAQQQLANTSLVLTEELKRRVYSIDTVLQTMRKVVPRLLTYSGGREIVPQQLQTMARAIEGVRTFQVLDAAGKVVASNRSELIGRDFAYRDYFRTMRQNPQPDRLHVTEPFTTVLGVYSVNLVRTIYGPKGEFAGIVSATIDQDSLRDLLLSLHAGPETRLSVVYDSGILIQLVPENPAIPPGTVVGKPGTFFSRHQDSGQLASLMSGVSGLTKTVSHISMRTLREPDLHMDHGLIVAAARDQDDILTRWQEMVWARIGIFLLITAVASFVLVAYELRRRQFEDERDRQIRQLRELNTKLEAAQNQLLQSEKMASLGQLAAGVAHELNNPIGFVHSNFGTLEQYLRDIFEITTACEQAASKASNPADFADIEALKQEKDFAFIRTDIFNLMAESQDGLERVSRIVQDLKDFSRPGETEWQWADLHKGLDSTLNVVWNELKYKCEIQKAYGDLPNVRCLPSQLNQVFMNLLVNASQAIAEKGVIAIRTGRQGGEVFVTIADTGCGIPPQNLKRIFEPFFTTKPVGKGTGLGLSLAYAIVQKHQGHIEVQSEIGKGTTFTIWLPIKPPENNSSAVPPAPTLEQP